MAEKVACPLFSAAPVYSAVPGSPFAVFFMEITYTDEQTGEQAWLGNIGFGDLIATLEDDDGQERSIGLADKVRVSVSDHSDWP